MKSMRYINFIICILGVLICFVGGCADNSRMVKPKKIVFLAGEKSHAPKTHEYEKGLRLFKSCLESSGDVGNIQAELYPNGWPSDPGTLDGADCIVLYSDGSDAKEDAHPFLVDERMEIIARQMKRGCGLVVIHYSTIVSSKKAGEEFLEWVGGYFDYENGTGPRNWYSKIQFAETMTQLASPGHPISQGVRPFRLNEEYYYNMRFREDDARLIPILATPIPGEPDVQTVAWAVQRRDGGRGFVFTGGHMHSNWYLPDLLKMMLNGIVWSAKINVPQGGVECVAAAIHIVYDNSWQGQL